MTRAKRRKEVREIQECREKVICQMRQHVEARDDVEDRITIFIATFPEGAEERKRGVVRRIRSAGRRGKGEGDEGEDNLCCRGMFSEVHTLYVEEETGRNWRVRTYPNL